MSKRTSQAIAAFTACLLVATTAQAQDWPQFRGADTTSSTQRDDLPIEWSVETGAGIAWAADLPGNGVSTPIIIDGRVILTAASGADSDRLHVLAFDQTTGTKLWGRQFWATGRTQVHHTSSVAAGTPASDGRRVFALFSSNDLVALDVDGNLLWIRSLTEEHPKLGNDIGMASSPVFVPTAGGGAVVVQCESQASAFIAGFDPQSGEKLWEVERPEDSNWASPTAVSADLAGTGAVLAQSGSDLTLYAAATGEVLWSESTGCATISSAIVSGDALLVPSGGVLALTNAGDKPEVAWQAGRVKPGSSSLAVSGGQMFAIARGGVLTAASLESGDPAWKKRLGGTFWATPLATPSRLYCANQDGKVFVVATEDGKVLAEHDMGAPIYGSPVTTEGALFLRSNEKLWKITTERTAQAPTSLQ